MHSNSYNLTYSISEWPRRGDAMCLLRHRKVSQSASGNQALLHPIGRENEEDFCSIVSPQGTEEG